MKKNFKIITLAVSLLLLIGAVIGVSVFAEETAPSIEIVRKNVSYEGAVKTLFVIDTENAEGYTIKVNFYDVDPATEGAEVAYTKGVDGKTTIDGVEYDVVFSKGIAPANLRKSIYAVPVLVDSEGNVVVRGETVEYSPYIYALNRFEKSPTEDQIVLYSALLDYGAAVQRLLCKPEDVAANGGYADEYCGIREDVAINGVRKETGSVNYYAPGTEVTLTANNMYGEAGVFHHFSDESNVSLGDGAYPKKTITASKPGVAVYTENYTVTGQVFNTLDTLCTDGSENDVNAIYSGQKESARDALGFYTNDGAFGNAKSDVYVKVVKESADSENQVIYGYNNGLTGNTNDIVLSLDNTVYYAKKYIVQFDLNWNGVGEDVQKGAAFLRFVNAGVTDGDIIYNYTLMDSGASGETYTIGGVTFNKNEWYTLRFEMVPESVSTYSIKMYVNGELAHSVASQSAVGANAKDNVYKFLGMRFNTRASAYGGSAYYSYQIDNTYVGYEMDAREGGEYFGNASIEGTRLEYDGITPGKDNIFTSDSYSGTAFNSSVVDGALTFAGNGMNVGLENKETKTGAKYVFETDILFDGIPASGKTSGTFGWYGLSASSCAKEQFFIFLSFSYSADADGNIEYINIVDAAKSTVLATLNHNEWYNIRFVYTPNNTYEADGVTVASGGYEGNLEIYVNDVLVTSYTTVGRGNTISNEQLYCMGFNLRQYGSSNLNKMTYYLDNTFIGAVPEAE